MSNPIDRHVTQDVSEHEDSVSLPSLDSVQSAAQFEISSLGLIQQFIVGRHRRSIEKEHVREVIQDIYQARYTIIKAQIDEKVSQAELKIQYEGDIVKKRLWLQYAQDLEGVSREITRQKTAFSMRATEDVIASIREIELSQKPMLERLENDLATGLISQDSYDRQADLFTQQRNILWERVQAAQKDMLNALDRQFEQAVSNLRSTHIG